MVKQSIQKIRATPKTAQQKDNIVKFYRDQTEFPNNCCNSDFSWIGHGTNPLDYSLNFAHDKDHSASLLTVVGTVGLMEGDKWNAYLHLTGWDPIFYRIN